MRIPSNADGWSSSSGSASRIAGSGVKKGR